MLGPKLLAAMLAGAGAMSLMPAAQAHEVCTPAVRINLACPSSCNETLKVSGWPYVTLVVRVCT